MKNLKNGILLIDDSLSLGLGDLYRYKITVNKTELDKQNIKISELHLLFKNTESPLLKPVYLTGPYSFYVDIRPFNYDEQKKFEGEEVQFSEDVKPNDCFKGILKINQNSRVEDSEFYCWYIDVLSQLSVITLPTLNFRLCVATEQLHEMPLADITLIEGFECENWDTKTLWNLPPKYPKLPVHLVIITHGIFSNIGCDMLYLKDKIEAAANGTEEERNPNLIVRGYMGNAGKSMRGIRWLGIRLARYIIETVDNSKTKYNVKYISFIGHSLGGPVQSMAIHYIAVERPDIFDSVNGLEPRNFITLASPYLGVVGDFPKFVSIALDIGALGQTGKDLTLQRTFCLPKEGLRRKEDGHQGQYRHKPLLEIIPRSPALAILERFQKRTLYANILHDGIVPLRTSALLYLDWKGLDQVEGARNRREGLESQPSHGNAETKNTGEIPEESMDKTSAIKWALPQYAVRRKYKKYVRTQIIDANGEEDSEKSSSNPKSFTPPPQASPFLSAAHVLIAPLPSQEYFTDPSTRGDKIVHDKMYHPDELPPPHYTHRKLIKKIIFPNDRIHRVQERIARKWQDTMEWRKVLADLQPDSHNNIVVRRRFVNSFGWVVVDHLASEHFGTENISNHG